MNACIAAGAGLPAAWAQSVEPTTLTIARAKGPIAIDGDLNDPGWQGAAKVETWYETNPGDNLAPKVKNVGYLAYDDKFFYAAFEFQDPDPKKIRAAFSDRDNVSGDTDYGGVILDTRNDGKTGILFLANPRGIQYDSVSDDTSGNEDSSPDFFWDSAAKITKDGWVLEMRIPFSSLRYPKQDPRTWGIMLYRNYPRDFRYQMFSTTLPRGGQCFICRSNKLTGLVGLPSAGHLVVAPYVSASQAQAPEGDVLGAPLKNDPFKKDIGFDLKWTPTANTALDATVNPDFSQIESDVQQISANERFALFYREKRPFFLEGVELLSTPISAVYTRTITSPLWGARTTGKFGSTAYTALFAEDRGGGSVIIPGSNSSDFADQEFKSLVAIGRVRRDLGRSFVSFLVTDREISGGGYNRVLGPDFQWRPSGQDTLTGQVLFSQSQTPVRPELNAEWDGRKLSGTGAYGWWSHSTPRIDGFTEAWDFSPEFRADDGYVPQVGYRRFDGEYGYTFRPAQGFFRRLRPFVGFDRSDDRAGNELLREYSIGLGMDARWSTFARFRYAFDHVLSGSLVLPRRQLLYNISTAPSRFLSGVNVYGDIGQEIDFDNHRTGTGATVNLSFTLRPTNHLELRFNDARRWVNVTTPDVGTVRLFTAAVDWVRATYNFNAKMYLRAIAQYVETRRDPALYNDSVPKRSADFNGSALFAYKLNWQTVLFMGYGDDRELTDTEVFEKLDRHFFVKLSYAWQH